MLRKVTMIVIMIVLAITSFMPGKALAASAAANISSTRFSLYRYDKDLYIDFTASCSRFASMRVYGYDGLDQYTQSPLNGNWRIWTKFNPRTTYSILLACLDSSGHETDWTYTVWYSGTTIRVNRTSVGSW